MMNRPFVTFTIFLSAVIIIGLGAILNTEKLGSYVSPHIGPSYLYPNPNLTPGKADTLSFVDITKRYGGLTYSQSHRNVTNSVKVKVCQEYSENCKVEKEIDHFYPLCAGGTNSIENLWAQPAVNIWNGQNFGFHAKDRLEIYICSQIKTGNLSPKIAYKQLTSDWVAYYLKVINTAATGSPQDVVE